MQHYRVELLDTETPVEKQVLDAFRENTRLLCSGSKFGTKETFDLSVYEVTGRKRNLAEHVLRFSGVEWNSNDPYEASVADPTMPGAEVMLNLGAQNSTAKTNT